ncbi:MAG TPA: transporter [Hyphomonadaceae bacterium]|jgi:hypothetical protein|nr:transporter [Hyphomonadaceae bacterium]
MRIVVVALLALMAAPCALAQSDPFVASRPGATEGPIAVPGGYLQLETEVASYARTRDSGFEADSYSLAASTLRYGLGDGWDAELVVQPFLRSEVTVGGIEDSADGFGDVTLRVLKNLSGQNGDGAAMAVIGYVSLPSATEDMGAGRVEGGGFLTGSFGLAEDWGAAWTVGAAARNMDGGDYQAEGSLALQLNHAFSERLSGYAEVAASRLEHDTQTPATFDVGAALLIGETTQVDAGVNFGITDSADDFQVFAGWAHRF